MVRILTVDCTRVKPRRHKTTPTAVAVLVAILSLLIATTTHLPGATILPSTQRTTTMVAAVEEGRELHQPQEQVPEEQEQEEQEPEEQDPQEAHPPLPGTGATSGQTMLAIPLPAADRRARPRLQQKLTRMLVWDPLGASVQDASAGGSPANATPTASRAREVSLCTSPLWIRKPGSTTTPWQWISLTQAILSARDTCLACSGLCSHLDQ